jgi:hypothetical protein
MRAYAIHHPEKADSELIKILKKNAVGIFNSVWSEPEL